MIWGANCSFEGGWPKQNLTNHFQNAYRFSSTTWIFQVAEIEAQTKNLSGSFTPKSTRILVGVFNQPLWKICLSKMLKIFPQKSGWTWKTYLSCPPPDEQGPSTSPKISPSDPQGLGHQLAWESMRWIPQLFDENPWGRLQGNHGGPIGGKLKGFFLDRWPKKL